MISSIVKSVWNPGTAASATPAPAHVAIPASGEATRTATGQLPWKAIHVDPAHSDSTDGTTIDIWIIPTAIMPAFAGTHFNLTEDEIVHARGLKRDADRIRYIAVRSLLRQALAFTANCEVGNGRAELRLNEFGKPELATKHGSLSFSITHAGAFSVVAVTTGGIVGVDAEKVEQARLKHLPFDCLSENEQRHLRTQSQDRRHVDFFRYWTLKEAYAKALGLGFSAEFDRIEFDLDPVRLESKAPLAAADTIETFDLTNVSFDDDLYFIAICLLNAGQQKDVLRKNIFVCGS